MADLFNQQISATYSGLLKTTSNGVLSSSLAQITDGRGNGSQLYLSTSKINFYNAYEFPTNDGSANQVLKTDGSGVLTWEDDANTGGVTKTGTIALNTIAVWNDNVDELRSDTTMSINTNHTISLLQPNSVPTDVSSYNIGGGNIANVTGQNNAGFGQSNMQRVTTGSNNVAFGNSTLDKLTTGSNNTAIGNLGLFSLTEGDGNTSVGESSLDDVTTGSNNIAIGKDSGSAITTGSNNVIIGTNAGSATLTNNIIISDGSGNNRIQVDSGGDATFSTGANRTLIIGNDSVDTGYNVVSLNGTTTKGSYSGLAGGGTSDDNLYLNSANDVVVQTGSGFSPKLTISSGGLATFSNGIQFGTGATLDAYEEGTWTPTMNTSQGNLGTFTSDGTYTRIGRLVTLQITYTMTATGSPTPSAGITLVQNIPFSKIGNESFLTGYGAQPISGKSINAFNYASGSVSIGFYLADGSFAAALNTTSIVTVQYLTP